MLGLAMTGTPLGEEADDQAAERSQDPQGIGAADSAAVLIERHIQALMSPVLNSPGHAIGFEPVCRVQSFGWQVSDEADGFVFASDMLPDQQGGLGGERKTDILRRDGTALQGAAFGNAFILLEGACLGERWSQRGKTPWAGWEPSGDR